MLIMSSHSRTVELSSMIVRNTAKVNEFFSAKGLPPPSLDEDAPINLPIPEDAEAIKRARTEVIEACGQLSAIMRGPRELLSFNVSGFHNDFANVILKYRQWTELTSLKIILRFKLDRRLP